MFIERYLFLALGILAVAIEIWALADCAKRKPASFEATFKRTKGFWMGITGGAAAVGLLSIFLQGGLFPILQLVAVVAACVYLADVKPAVSETQSSGPYGPW